MSAGATPAMRREIDGVLARLNSLIGADGSRLSLVEAGGDSLTVRFEMGGDAACERCAIDKDAMEMLVREAVTNHLPTITNVHLVNT
jgi:hypothetical protein